MGISETLVFYFVIGVGVAIAVLAVQSHAALLERLYLCMTAMLFWPLYLPVLLSSQKSSPLRARVLSETDELSLLVAQVSDELDSAVLQTDGDKQTTNGHASTINDLKAAWQAQTTRIHEMDSLLAELRQRHDSELSPQPLTARVADSEQARRENLEQLQQVRQAQYEELMASLAHVRELVSVVHLTRFTDGAKPRSDHFDKQLAAALCDVNASNLRLRQNNSVA